MIKRLRTKFVLVTTSLMLVVFGTFLILNSLYSNYWNDMEIAGMLNWIAYSGVFTASEQSACSEPKMELLKEERPIFGIILDGKGNIVSSKVMGVEAGSESNMLIERKTLDKMLECGSSEYKADEYYYSYNKLKEGQILLVIMDDSFYGSVAIWWLGRIALAVLGVILLIGLTFFLSRFVTEPAEQSLIREKRFISDAGHELKTPLGAISINAQALEIENPENLFLKNIVTESERMSRLIERLLMLSKLDETSMTKIEALPISDICDEMSLTYETIAFEKKIDFEYEIEEELSFNGNADEIRQLLVILIDNAFKNVDRNGRVELICKKERNHICIAVSNTGHGIAAEDLSHIFERFYTTDKSRNNGSFGLGLAIAKSIVERHGGSIEARSEQEKKTEFIVLL